MVGVREGILGRESSIGSASNVHAAAMEFCVILCLRPDARIQTTLNYDSSQFAWPVVGTRTRILHSKRHITRKEF